MKKFKGFTLIELVVVIAILAILAAVAIPKFVDLSKKAKKATAISELGALRAAAQLYYATTAVGGTAAYPANAAVLTRQLQVQPAQLSKTAGASGATPFRWRYNVTSGVVASVGGTGSGWTW